MDACRRGQGMCAEFHVDLRSKTSQYFCDFISKTWKVLFNCRVKRYDDFCYLHYIIYVLQHEIALLFRNLRGNLLFPLIKKH
jgi:hypothetical protein